METMSREGLIWHIAKVIAANEGKETSYNTIDADRAYIIDVISAARMAVDGTGNPISMSVVPDDTNL